MSESSTNSGFDPARIRELRSNLTSTKMSLSSLRGKREAVLDNAKKLKTQVDDLNTRVDQLKLIEAYLSKFADERQEKVFRQLEETVSEGLKAVFQEDIRLEVSTKTVGARAETHFTVVSQTDDGELRTSIMDARGGGLAAIVGFLIQAVLVLLTPGLRPIVFLDESFMNVSEDYQAPLGEFIKDLCEKTGLQVVLVTHQPTIAEFADVWYAFNQRSGNTQIKKIV